MEIQFTSSKRKASSYCMNKFNALQAKMSINYRNSVSQRSSLLCPLSCIEDLIKTQKINFLKLGARFFILLKIGDKLQHKHLLKIHKGPCYQLCCVSHSFILLLYSLYIHIVHCMHTVQYTYVQCILTI